MTRGFEGCLFLFVGLLQGSHINLLHLQHRLHHSARFAWVFVLRHLAQRSGNDLPGHAILIFEPAALVLLSALRKPIPEPVYFLPCFAPENVET